MSNAPDTASTAMIFIKDPHSFNAFISNAKAAGKSIGFVPTMGALHAGHMDLVRISNERTGLTVVSIFVNPTQFNDPGDFKKYPQTLEKDIQLLDKTGTAVLLAPRTGDMYPAGLQNLETYDLGYLETLLEGKFRPGHFQGVCQVMNRLLKMVEPDQLFMGQKDYQQCMVVQRLLELMKSRTRLVTCPTVREADGLAMSSRNMRLTPEQRAIAPGIYQTLKAAAQQIPHESFESIQNQALQRLADQGFRPEYFEIADARTLKPAHSFQPGKQLVLLVAAFLGEIRLIDNLLT